MSSTSETVRRVLAVAFLALGWVACDRGGDRPVPPPDSASLAAGVEASEDLGTPSYAESSAPQPSEDCLTRPTGDAPLLVPGQPARITVAPGALTRVLLDLEAETFLQIEASQETVDVHLRLCSPEGLLLATRDSAWPQELGMSEKLSALPKQTGRHVLLVGADYEGGPSEVQATVRPAEARDPDRVRAENLQFRNLVDILYERESPETAEALEEAARIWRSLEERLLEAEALHWAASAFKRLEDCEKASSLFQQSLPFWRGTDIQQREAETHDHLGECYKERKDPAQAREHLRQAVDVWQSLGKPEEEAKASSTFAAFLYNQGHAFEARPHFERAVELRRENGDRPGLIKSLTGLGTTLSDLGELRQALQHQQEALALSEEIGGVTTPVLNNLAGAYGAVGEFELAERTYDRALDLLDRKLARLDKGSTDWIKTRTRQATSINNRAWALTGQDRYDEALTGFQVALEISLELGDRDLEAITLSHLGRTHSNLDRLDRGRIFLQRSAQIREIRQESHKLGPTLRDLGELERRAGNLQAAREHLDRALALAKLSRSRLRQAQALTQLTLVDGAEGDLSTALQRSEEALQLTEWLRDRVPRRDLQETFSASKHYYYENHISVLMDAPGDREEHLQNAFEMSDSIRARGLLAVLREAEVGVYRDAPAELIQRERELHQRLVVASSEGNRTDAGIDSLVTEMRQVQQELRERSPSYATLHSPEPATLEEIQRFLSPEDTLIEYFLGFERSFAWAVTSSSLYGVELPARPEIESLVRELRHALETTDDKALELAERLAELVVAPLEPHLQGSRLIVVPDGALHYVPFAALPLPGTGELLVDRYETSYGASAGFLVELAKRWKGRSDPPKVAAVLADPVFSSYDSRLKGEDAPNQPPQDQPPTTTPSDTTPAAATSRGQSLQRLRQSAEEARDLQRLAVPGRVLLKEGVDASRETLLSLDLSEYRILHLATHGYADSTHPELSKLTFSQFDGEGREIPGDVLLPDIFDLELQTELVVLSACQTALGREIRGEGLVGLTRGFFHAGSRQVMASLWRVTDHSTRFLMKAFYENLLVGSMTPPEALREAQLTLRQRQGFEHPRFWAGFVVQGAPPP